MASDFFRSLGLSVARELSQPEGRERLRDTMGETLSRHVSRPGMARDQSFGSGGMGTRGGRGGRDQLFQEKQATYNQGNEDQEEEGNGTMLDANACMLLITKCIRGLDPEERDLLVGQLTDYLQTTDATDGALTQGRSNVPPYGSGVRPNNQGSLDQRSGKRGAHDGRRPAQDAAIRELQHSNFAKRWPDAMKVSLSLTGRR